MEPGQDEPFGHRAVLIRLHEAHRERLLQGILFRPDARSVMYRFPDAARYENGDFFGAVIEQVDEQPDGQLRVVLWLWSDLAATYVRPGARFEVWYARTVGEGVVLPWPDAGSVVRSDG